MLVFCVVETLRRDVACIVLISAGISSLSDYVYTDKILRYIHILIQAIFQTPCALNELM